jgi:hypothetical protein
MFELSLACPPMVTFYLRPARARPDGKASGRAETVAGLDHCRRFRGT